MKGKAEMKILDLKATEILDALGNPTIECTLTLENKITTRSSVPAGTSVGRHEAFQLYDGDPARYNGKGVLKAIANIHSQIKPAILGKNPDIQTIDKIMLELDGTKNKSQLGANAILATSTAVARAQAAVQNLELYNFLGQEFKIGQPSFPSCMFNIMNGGVHASNKIAFQEFMIMPKFDTVRDAIRCASTIYGTLRKILIKDGLSTGVGYEGGFAPLLSQNSHKENTFLDYLIKAIQEAGFNTETVAICLDVAASEFFNQDKGLYKIENQLLSAEELIQMYTQLVENYPIASIEDGMAQDDWHGWELLTQKLGHKVQLVGDDIFVTNIDRIRKGMESNIANAVLIKPNQIGTVSETIQAIKFCKKNGYKTVISHRSGETNDTFIADLAVGTASEQFKAGAPCRGERVAKYNRLMEIEDSL